MTAKPTIIDFPTLAERLLADAPTLLRQWFPAGKLRGREYVIGNIRGDAGDSLNINIDKGCWLDHATGESGGDLISLYAAIHNIKQSEAAKQLGGGATTQEDVFVIGQVCHPLPRHKYGKPTNVFEYKNAQGELYGYICRFDPLNEPKQFAPLTCWQKVDGKYIWKWKKWPIDSLPYRIQYVVGNPAAKILIVEGEKKADLAQKLLPEDWIAIGWCGGAEAVKRTDWQLLQARYCWIWPDADKPGIKSAQTLKRILPDLHIVQLPENLPQAWDLGDAPNGFNVVEHLQPKSKPVQQLSQQEVVGAGQDKDQQAQLIFTHYDPEKPARLLGTLENLRCLLNYYKIIIRYNVISKRIFFCIPGETFSVENGEDAAFACVFSYMKEWKLPVDGYQPYLMRIADENQYNPVMQWMTGKPWDCISRLQAFYDTITSPETEAKELLLRRWLITAVCMAKGEGVDSAGCLVLQGPQDIGKTWWVKKLVPERLRKELIRTAASVDPHDKDSVSQIISYWIVELGEIDATFWRADLQALKAFITSDEDTMRRPYGIGDKKYPRRTALIASVDQTIYLNDTSANRRFWTIPCTAINSYHDIDMQQLWAEVLHLIENQAETWQLAPDEKAHIARINEEHMQIDPIYEMLLEKYSWKTENQDCKSATTIAAELGLKNVSQKETRSITSYVLKLGGERETGGAKRLKIPFLRFVT